MFCSSELAVVRKKLLWKLLCECWCLQACGVSGCSLSLPTGTEHGLGGVCPWEHCVGCLSKVSQSQWPSPQFGCPMQHPLLSQGGVAIFPWDTAGEDAFNKSSVSLGEGLMLRARGRAGVSPSVIHNEFLWFVYVENKVLPADDDSEKQVPECSLIPSCYEAEDGCVICILNDDVVFVGGGTVMCAEWEKFRAEEEALRRSPADCEVCRDLLIHPHHPRSVCEEVQNTVILGCWYAKASPLSCQLQRPDCVEGGTIIQEQKPHKWVGGWSEVPMPPCCQLLRWSNQHTERGPLCQEPWRWDQLFQTVHGSLCEYDGSHIVVFLGDWQDRTGLEGTKDGFLRVGDVEEVCVHLHQLLCRSSGSWYHTVRSHSLAGVLLPWSS